jgi:hypothetical protein
MMIMNPDDETANSDICSGELTFDVPYPLEPINSYHYPDLHHHSSGWLIAFPVEVFVRPSNMNLRKAIKKLKKETKKLGVIPFVTFCSGNYSFGIRLKTKNPTKEENQKMYDAFNDLRHIDWPGGFGLYNSK